MPSVRSGAVALVICGVAAAGGMTEPDPTEYTALKLVAALYRAEEVNLSTTHKEDILEWYDRYKARPGHAGDDAEERDRCRALGFAIVLAALNGRFAADEVLS